MKGKNNKDVYIQAITMIDPDTSWIEIRSVLEARADLVANQVEPAWLTGYPLPKKITVNRGKELLLELKTIMATDYRKPFNSTSVRSTQANSTTGNIICSFNIQQMDLDNENPWEGLL